jgi:superfamily II DNA or RNA helicase
MASTWSRGRRAIAGFNNLAFKRCRGISHALIVHSAEEDIPALGVRTGQIGLAGWQGLGKTGWERILAGAKRLRVRPPAPKKPKRHQERAVADARSHYRDHARGRLVMPCGTGKSLTGFLIAEALGADTIVVAAPSLSLIRQNLAGWSEEFDARGRSFDCLCVCSDQTVGERGDDEIDEDPSALGIEVTTDLDEIVKRLRRPRNRPLVVFTTYHSSPLLAAASHKARFTFDFGLMDEAHKTVGAADRAFATMLDDDQIRIAKRLAMTATERVYRGDQDGVLSMDDEEVYGACFHQLSFKAAIEQKLICDYKLVTFFVAESEIKKLIEDNASLDLSHKGEKAFTEANALSLASGIALKSVIRDSGVKHAISFHRTIKIADAFRRQQDELNRFPALGPAVINLHISGKNSTAERAMIMDEFASSEVSCVSNARCLTEGIDVPRTDCVLFEEAKQSAIDIAQAAGRAMRVFPGKEFGYIVVPVVVPDDASFEDFAATTEFRKVAQTLTAISTLDERLAVEFREISEGRRPKGGGILDIRGTAPAVIGMEFAKFAEAVRTKVWSAAVSRTNWRPFDEARAFVHGLGLKNTREWKEFARSDRMPADIPNAVDRIYALAGWKDWGDFLGTGVVADKNKKWRPFEEAREFVRSLGLRGNQAWREFVKTVRKPDDIPSRPDVAYAEEGWISYGDWMGKGRGWRPFEEARAYVRELRLANNKEWLTFAGSDHRPRDIPYSPHVAYANSGWKGMDDWLGADLTAEIEAPSFR